MVQERKFSGDNTLYYSITLTVAFLILFFISAITLPFSASAEVIINEIDSSTPGVDNLEFIELYDGGTGNTDLNGLVIVLYNGSSDLSYAAFDLDSYFTNPSGYFVLGNAAVPNVDLIFADNTLQNGADALALYTGDAADFPNGTSVTTTGLIDAVVYDTDDADDPELLILLNQGQPQVNENETGDQDNHSNQRSPNGAGGARNTITYVQLLPSPGTANGEIPPSPPVPDIKANGYDGEISITPPDTINITVSLDPADKKNVICDWWIGALTPYGNFWVDPSLDWIESDIPLSVGQYPLFNLLETSLLTTQLPEGIYTFFYILDDNPNGILDATWYDYVNVISSSYTVPMFESD